MSLSGGLVKAADAKTASLSPAVAEGDQKAASLASAPAPSASASSASASASTSASAAASVTSTSGASCSASGGALGGAVKPRAALQYYSSDEVSTHITSADCWVSYFGRVYNLTPLLAAHNARGEGVLCAPIVRFAGTDITHWFDAQTKQPKTYIDPVLNVRMPYCPFGRYIHIPPSEPAADWNTDFGVAWWADDRYAVGLLSRAKRTIRVVNTLTEQDDRLDVCAEETLSDIRNRYLKVNAHAGSYTWKSLGRPLNMNKTLDENGIPDESADFAALRMDDSDYVPVLNVYFNDDLTVG